MSRRSNVQLNLSISLVPKESKRRPVVFPQLREWSTCWGAITAPQMACGFAQIVATL